VGPLKQSVLLPDQADYIECESWWEMGLETHPEATYLLYPLAVPQAVARLDLGGQAIVAGQDQLPGVCRDYFTAQQWVDFSNESVGVTIALPENPLVQLGDFHFGHNQTEFTLERAMLLGWVTNNYWETNFRAHQPGQVRARYRLTPHQGDFNEAQAHRLGLDAAYGQLVPIWQHLGELAAAPPLWPGAGSLLQLPGQNSPVLTLHVKPAKDSTGLVVRLLNASDEAQPAEIGSGLLHIVAAHQCDLLEKPLQPLEVQNGIVSLSLPPRGLVTVQLQTN
jgi:alpha-mannosidase